MKLTGQKGRPLLAAVLSGLFPGIGQLYNRQFRKGALFVTAGIVAGFGPFSPAAAHLDLDNPTVALEKTLITSIPFIVINLWAVIDAYRVAKAKQPA
jgi:hypothetical protein